MAPPILSIAGIGLGFGTIHVLTGPDHLSALATLSANEGDAKKSFWLGVKWGVGHSIGLVVVAVVLLAATAGRGEEDGAYGDDDGAYDNDGAYDDVYDNAYDDGDEEQEVIDVSDGVSSVLESCVGIFMILLGLWGMREAWRKERNGTVGGGVEMTRSRNDGIDDDGRLESIAAGNFQKTTYAATDTTPTTATDFVRMDDEKDPTFDDDDNNNDDGGKKDDGFLRTLITIAIGIVHGIAGPGGVLGVIPAVQLHKWNLAILYLGCFCVSSTLTMGCFAAIWGVCSSRTSSSRIPYCSRITAFWVEIFSASLSVVVGVLWLVLLSLGILDDVFP